MLQVQGLWCPVEKALVSMAKPLEWHPIGIMTKELVLFIIGGVVWGPCFAYKMVYFCVTKGYSRNKTAIHLLKGPYGYFTATFNINIVSQHIPGVTNIQAII